MEKNGNTRNDEKEQAEENLRTWCIRNDAEPDIDLSFFKTNSRENLPNEIRLYRGLTWLDGFSVYPELKVPPNFEDYKINDDFVVKRDSYQSWSKREPIARSFAKRLDKGIVITAVFEKSELLVDASPYSPHQNEQEIIIDKHAEPKLTKIFFIKK